MRSARISCCRRTTTSRRLATSSTPEVILSSRVSRAGVSPDGHRADRCSSALMSVPFACRYDGCTTSPAGLLMAIRCASSKSTSRPAPRHAAGPARESPARPPAGGRRSATRQAARGAGVSLTSTRPAAIHFCTRARETPGSWARWRSSTRSSRWPMSPRSMGTSLQLRSGAVGLLARGAVGAGGCGRGTRCKQGDVARLGLWRSRGPISTSSGACRGRSCC